VRSIHAAGTISRSGLVAATGLSFGTVSSICAGLIDWGVVVEASRHKPAVGRPTGHLSLDASCGILVGVDIAETYIHAETFDASLGNLSAVHAPMTDGQQSPAEIVSQVRRVIDDQLTIHDSVPVLGFGVSVPGVFDPAAGTSVFAPNWNWHDVPLQKMLSDAIHGPIHVNNPLKYLALAELWLDQARLEQTFVFLNLGTGVGAGIVINGQVLTGRTNSAGEWGHTVLVAGGRPCRCGSRGCVEAYIGAPGIIRTLQELHPESPYASETDQTAVIAALCRDARAGDLAALDVIDRTAQYLGEGIASVINLLNPDVVVIGGWVGSELGELLLDRARPVIGACALDTPARAVELEIRAIERDPVCLGAAASAMEQYLESVVFAGDMDTPAVPVAKHSNSRGSRALARDIEYADGATSSRNPRLS